MQKKRIIKITEKMKKMHPTVTNERIQPRSRTKYEVLKMIEKKTGKKVGNIGNRVWVDDSNHDAGVWELDECGNEVKWHPNPELDEK